MVVAIEHPRQQVRRIIRRHVRPTPFGLGRCRRHRRQSDLLARIQTSPRFDARTINSHLPRSHPFCQLAIGDIGEMPLEPAVETNVVIVLRHLHMPDGIYFRLVHTNNMRPSRSPRNNAPIAATTETIT